MFIVFHLSHSLHLCTMWWQRLDHSWKCHFRSLLQKSLWIADTAPTANSSSPEKAVECSSRLRIWAIFRWAGFVQQFASASFSHSSLNMHIAAGHAHTHTYWFQQSYYTICWEVIKATSITQTHCHEENTLERKWSWRLLHYFSYFRELHISFLWVYSDYWWIAAHLLVPSLVMTTWRDSCLSMCGMY